jgi:hypothetical protein
LFEIIILKHKLNRAKKEEEEEKLLLPLAVYRTGIAPANKDTKAITRAQLRNATHLTPI